MTDKWNRFEEETNRRKKNRQKETKIVTKISRTILIVVLSVLLIGGIGGSYYVYTAMQPVDSANTQTVEIEIPSGSTSAQVANILEQQHIIKNGSIFRLYTKIKNAAEFKSGFYQFAPSMNYDELIKLLTAGGDAISKKTTKLLVREGETIEAIAKQVEEATDYSANEFIAAVNDETFYAELVKTYPALLTSSVDAKDVRYHLEGYLFPATYEVQPTQSLQDIIKMMVKKTDEVMTPYYATISEKGTTVHAVLTMASLLEKEAITLEDRKEVAGVFNNRLRDNMMLQTDVSVLYALNVEKELVTEKDLTIDSPYNLYQHYGVGPGPFNSPSEQAISAALSPNSNEYLYFLADTSTGKVYYAKTYEEHLELKAKYIDAKE